jgi:hypothetical protein
MGLTHQFHSSPTTPTTSARRTIGPLVTPAVTTSSSIVLQRRTFQLLSGFRTSPMFQVRSTSVIDKFLRETMVHSLATLEFNRELFQKVEISTPLSRTTIRTTSIQREDYLKLEARNRVKFLET